MCDSTTLDAWQARCIKDLLAIPGVELALIIGNHGRTTDTYQTPLRGALSQILDRIRHGWFLWTVYYLLWVKRRTPALQPGKPPADTHRRFTANSRMSRIANQKFGIAIPI